VTTPTDLPETRANYESLALFLTIPSVMIVLAYSAALVAFGSDAPAKIPWLMILGLAPLLGSVDGIPAIFRSRYRLPTKLLLLGCHLLGDCVALAPIVGLILLMVVMGGSINPG
jgi:hypothetical protein